MTKDEVLRLALEALEAMQMYAEAERKGLRICDEAITAIKEALAQPQRTWVGLTDEEIIDVNLSKVKRLIDDPIVCDTDHNIIELGKAIEAKLKEKNT